MATGTLQLLWLVCFIIRGALGTTSSTTAQLEVEVTLNTSLNTSAWDLFCLFDGTYAALQPIGGDGSTNTNRMSCKLPDSLLTANDTTSTRLEIRSKFGDEITSRSLSLTSWQHASNPWTIVDQDYFCFYDRAPFSINNNNNQSVALSLKSPASGSAIDLTNEDIYCEYTVKVNGTWNAVDQRPATVISYHVNVMTTAAVVDCPCDDSVLLSLAANESVIYDSTTIRLLVLQPGSQLIPVSTRAALYWIKAPTVRSVRPLAILVSQQEKDSGHSVSFHSTPLVNNNATYVHHTLQCGLFDENMTLQAVAPTADTTGSNSTVACLLAMSSLHSMMQRYACFLIAHDKYFNIWFYLPGQLVHII